MGYSLALRADRTNHTEFRALPEAIGAVDSPLGNPLIRGIGHYRSRNPRLAVLCHRRAVDSLLGAVDSDCYRQNNTV